MKDNTTQNSTTLNDSVNTARVGGLGGVGFSLCLGVGARILFQSDLIGSAVFLVCLAFVGVWFFDTVSRDNRRVHRQMDREARLADELTHEQQLANLRLQEYQQKANLRLQLERELNLISVSPPTQSALPAVNGATKSSALPSMAYDDTALNFKTKAGDLVNEKRVLELARQINNELYGKCDPTDENIRTILGVRNPDANSGSYRVGACEALETRGRIAERKSGRKRLFISKEDGTPVSFDQTQTSSLSL